MTGGRWKRYQEAKFLLNERKFLEERLKKLTNNQEQGDLRHRIGPQRSGGFQPQPVTLNNGRWIHFGNWSGQPQYNRTKLTDLVRYQRESHQRVGTTPCRFPWKKAESTQKLTKTHQSWNYQQ